MYPFPFLVDIFIRRPSSFYLAPIFAILHTALSPNSSLKSSICTCTMRALLSDYNLVTAELRDSVSSDRNFKIYGL